GVRIDADALAREGRTLPADVPGGATVPRAPGRARGRLDALPRAQAAVQRWPFTDQVARHSRFGRGAPDQRAQRGQLRSLRRREVFLDGLDRLDDVRVGGEDAIPRPGHGSPSLRTESPRR